MTKTIYIFRHGQTDYNVARRVMGQLDIPLNDVGRIQAAELANKLETGQKRTPRGITTGCLIFLAVQETFYLWLMKDLRPTYERNG